MMGIVFGFFSYAFTGNFFFGLAWRTFTINFTNLESWTKKQNASMVKPLWSVSSLPSVPTPPPVRSSPASSDGLHHRSSDDFDSNRRYSQEHMTYDWTLLQTLIFVITPYFLMLAFASKDEDDDDSGGGTLQPAYMPTQWGRLILQLKSLII